MHASRSTTTFGRLSCPQASALAQFHPEPRLDVRSAVQGPDTDKPFFERRAEAAGQRRGRRDLLGLKIGTVTSNSGATRRSPGRLVQVRRNQNLLHRLDSLQDFKITFVTGLQYVYLQSERAARLLGAR